MWLLHAAHVGMDQELPGACNFAVLGHTGRVCQVFGILGKQIYKLNLNSGFARVWQMIIYNYVNRIYIYRDLINELMCLIYCDSIAFVSQPESENHDQWYIVSITPKQLGMLSIHHRDLKPPHVAPFRWCIGTWTVLGCNKCAASMKIFTCVWHCGTTTADRPWFQTSALGFQVFANRSGGNRLGPFGAHLFERCWFFKQSNTFTKYITDMHWHALTRSKSSCWKKWRMEATRYTFEPGMHSISTSRSPKVYHCLWKRRPSIAAFPAFQGWHMERHPGPVPRPFVPTDGKTASARALGRGSRRVMANFAWQSTCSWDERCRGKGEGDMRRLIFYIKILIISCLFLE